MGLYALDGTISVASAVLNVESFPTRLSWELFRETSLFISETSTKTALGKTSVFVKHTILSAFVPSWTEIRSNSEGLFCHLGFYRLSGKVVSTGQQCHIPQIRFKRYISFLYTKERFLIG